jgi:hypothetical protein
LGEVDRGIENFRSSVLPEGELRSAKHVLAGGNIDSADTVTAPESCVFTEFRCTGRVRLLSY